MAQLTLCHSRVLTALPCSQAACGGSDQRHGVEPHPASFTPPTCLNDQDSPGEVLNLPENAKLYVQVGEAKMLLVQIYKVGGNPIFVNIF